MIFIRDNIIKSKFPKNVELSKIIKPLLPDGSYLSKKIPVFLEYENSSRGMTFGVAKYLYKCNQDKIKCRVVFIESLKHNIQHEKDTQYAKNIVKMAKSKYVSFDFYIVKDESELDSILKKILN